MSSLIGLQLKIGGRDSGERRGGRKVPFASVLAARPSISRVGESRKGYSNMLSDVEEGTLDGVELSFAGRTPPVLPCRLHIPHLHKLSALFPATCSLRVQRAFSIQAVLISCVPLGNTMPRSGQLKPCSKLVTPPGVNLPTMLNDGVRTKDLSDKRRRGSAEDSGAPRG